MLLLFLNCFPHLCLLLFGIESFPLRHAVRTVQFVFHCKEVGSQLHTFIVYRAFSFGNDDRKRQPQ